MDIAGLSVSLSNAKVANAFSTAMLAKQLDVAKDAGQSLVASLDSMPSPSLETSVNPSVGSNIDLTV
ncbi:MAG TPA: putative motility protein [Lachnospiraceae bacterium]|jgi:hypothetical protein|nr:YjfB family protein [Lachnospiraceae bacterium]MDD6148592.1 YjfB family protein [Lachnospiraceae bacterium]MDY5705204.1 YjfB family protein [Lachnospiraceae bacterium]MEE3357327.1 YjfB family protein [Lachnospiraceae bacterium]HAN50306.1 putative motility protein [Lachnospiraceae bacterium]